MEALPILVIIGVFGFLAFAGVSRSRLDAKLRRTMARDTSAEPRLTPDEQAQVLALVNATNARRAYTQAAVNGRLPQLPQSTFQRVGTALFLAEMGYGSYRLLGGGHHHEHHDHGGFDAVDLDNLS